MGMTFPSSGDADLVDQRLDDPFTFAGSSGGDCGPEFDTDGVDGLLGGETG
jgi:hypothetical protein